MKPRVISSSFRDPEVVPAGSHAHAKLSHPFCGAVNHRTEQEQTTGNFADFSITLVAKRNEFIEKT